MLDTDYSLVFEVGGTTTRAGLYDVVTNNVVEFSKVATPNYLNMPDATGPAIKQRLFEEIGQLGKSLSRERVPGIVVLAFPGPLDLEGRVLAAPTVWGDRCQSPVVVTVPLKCLWPKARIMILNDVTAAGYSYLRHPEDELCIVTVGSGIGNKVFIKGVPAIGENGHGGEIGHIRVDFSKNAPLCDCGQRGHLGAVGSGRASMYQVCRLADADPTGFKASSLGRKSQGRPEFVTNEMIVEATRIEDTWTLKLIGEMARPLGWVLASIYASVGIKRFVIVGGFGLALGEHYRTKIAKAAEHSTWDIGTNWDTMIELGTDEHAALKGAGLYAHQAGALV